MEFFRANTLLEMGLPLPLRRRALADGYLFFRELIEPGTILQLRKEVLAICSDRGWLKNGVDFSEGIARPGMRTLAYDDPQFIELQVKVNLLPEFSALRTHPRILAVLDCIFGGPPEIQCGDVCRLVFPYSHAQTTPPHQDHFYVHRSTALWTVWLPLGDCPRRLGSLRVIPRSHKGGLREHSGEGIGRQAVAGFEEEDWVSGDFRCGDALFFNSLTIHSAHQNCTRNKVRVSVDFRYSPTKQRARF